ncbi:hypothetical protein [Nocardia sp. NPDC057455]|uniref:hypothetical protein n=1 Tax=Nocardia sp. NPDC057455 TaxID=3346138 RepID=UPI00366CF4CC
MTTAGTYRPFAPATCELCASRVVYRPRWCCSLCFETLPIPERWAVREVADLALDDPKKVGVIKRCVAAYATGRRPGTRTR